MATLDRNALFTALDLFARAPSVMAPDRVCLASSQGKLPDLRGRGGFIVHEMRSALPWFLWPLRLLVAAGRCLVELTEPDSVVAFAREADDCFTVTLHSFSRSLLPSVLSRLESEGWDEAAGAAHQDPTYAELEYNCTDSHDAMLLFTRGNRECPPDLSRCFADIEALEEDPN